jgi:hypothetical protein
MNNLIWSTCGGAAKAFAVAVSAMLTTPMHPAQPAIQDAERLLAMESAPFEMLAPLAERVRSELAVAGDPESRGRAALVWVRVMRRTLDGIPMTSARDDEPYRSWLARHDADVVYSEPAGQWLIAPEVIWTLHDGVKHTAAAEPVAWEAVENGLPGECEGYPPCYLSGFTMLHGRYLASHPRGAHAAEVIQLMAESLAQIERLLGERSGHELFNAATDCQDLQSASDEVLKQIGAVAAAEQVRAAIGRLRSRCRGM